VREIYRAHRDRHDPLDGRTKAAAAVAVRLRAAECLTPTSRSRALARPRKPGGAPARQRREAALVLFAHLDVVEAKREDWSADPFVLLEKDGLLWPRHADDKAMAAIFTASFLRMQREKTPLDRDVILVLDRGRGGDENGADWLLREHRALVDGGLS
jgi:acetylornithine deacetylase/succinyl-diaminopimelate desuccinylase-like protein